MNPAEELATLYDSGSVSAVIRPAAIIPEDATRSILAAIALQDVQLGGHWQSEPSLWTRYDRPWQSRDDAGAAQLIGTIQCAYGTPTRHEITIYRATVTRYGDGQGWTVESLCDDALALGGLTLASCPRAMLAAPPKVFRFQSA